MMGKITATALLLCTALAAHGAAAEDTIRIGIIGPFSGPFALQGTEFKHGIEAYTGIHGTTVAGHKVEFIYRDVGGTNPAEAGRLARELIVGDKVSLLGGFYLSPEAAAAAPVVTESKTPSVLFVAGALPLIKQSPYFVRVGCPTATVYEIQAEWATKRGFKRAYIAVADYAPGYDSEAAFKSRFTALGGQIVGDDRMPLSTVDYATYVERIANAKPDVVSVFIPDGAPTIAFVRALTARGFLRDGKTTMLGNGEWDDTGLPQLDNSVVGFYSVMPYTTNLDIPENTKFRDYIAKHFGADPVPNYSAADAYDGVRLFYRMIEAQHSSSFDPDAAMAAVKGYKWDGPRGPVEIDAATREDIYDLYVRRVEQVNGKKQNVVIDTFTGITPK